MYVYGIILTQFHGGKTKREFEAENLGKISTHNQQTFLMQIRSNLFLHFLRPSVIYISRSCITEAKFTSLVLKHFSIINLFPFLWHSVFFPVTPMNAVVEVNEDNMRSLIISVACRDAVHTVKKARPEASLSWNTFVCSRIKQQWGRLKSKEGGGGRWGLWLGGWRPAFFIRTGIITASNPSKKPPSCLIPRCLHFQNKTWFKKLLKDDWVK